MSIVVHAHHPTTMLVVHPSIRPTKPYIYIKPYIVCGTQTVGNNIKELQHPTPLPLIATLNRQVNTNKPNYTNRKQTDFTITAIYWICVYYFDIPVTNYPNSGQTKGKGDTTLTTPPQAVINYPITCFGERGTLTIVAAIAGTCIG